MSFDVGAFIANQANALGTITTQISAGENLQTLPALFKDKITVHHCRIKNLRQSIVGEGLLLGHPQFGLWGTGKWADSQSSTSFILDSSVYGVLDQNYIGDRTSAWALVSVHNDNDLFPENFENDRFIDLTLSTGSLCTGSYIIDKNQSLYTDYIAKDDRIFTKVMIYNVEAVKNDGTSALDGLEIYCVANGIEYPLVPNELLTIPNTTQDGIKLRFRNIYTPDTIFGVSGLSFPFTFTELTPITLKYYDCKYYE